MEDNEQKNGTTEQLKQAGQNIAKNAGKKAGKRVVSTLLKHPFVAIPLIVLIIIIVVIFLASSEHRVTMDNATYKKNDVSNVPYAVDEVIKSVTIGSDGKLTMSKSAQELWDELIKNNSKVQTYLDSPDELLKLMNAEMTTNYIDTRSNVEEEIDWDSINKNVESKEVQGIVKLKRSFDNGTNSYITYVDPATFQSYIDEYNATGSEEARQRALSHFTLEKDYGYSFYTDAKVLSGTTINIPEGLGKIKTYEAWDYPRGNVGATWSSSSLQYKLWEQAKGLESYDADGFGVVNGRFVIACTTTYGKVGDYIDFYLEDGNRIPCIIGDIKSQSDPGCNVWGHNNGGCIIEFMVKTDPWYTVHRKDGIGDPTVKYHTEWRNKAVVKAVNGGSYFENPNIDNKTIETTEKGYEHIEEYSEEVEESQNEDGSSNTTGISTGVSHWPLPGKTYISSQFGPRASPGGVGSTNHRGIDIPAATGTEIEAAETGVVIQNSYAGARGWQVLLGHGKNADGKEVYTRYQHMCRQSPLQIGQTVNKGQVVGYVGNTGAGTGAHLHFEVLIGGYAYKVNEVNPLNFKYDNGIGNGTGGIGGSIQGTAESGTSQGGASSVNIVVKVATWNQTTDTLQSTDPEVSGYSNTTYSMTSTKINYSNLVSQYTMPFDYLWAWLVVGQDKDFVMDLAELVYGSQIEITVYDNLSTNTNVTTTTYNRMMKQILNGAVVSYEKTNGDEGVQRGSIKQSNPIQAEGVVGNYKTVHTVITKTNTLNVDLTKANTWIMDYSKEYTYQQETNTSPTSGSSYPDEIYPNAPSETSGTDRLGLANQFLANMRSTYPNASLTSRGTSSYYYKTVNKVDSITNTTVTNKYVASPAVKKEKTDKKALEPNFVTLYLDHPKVRNVIQSASSWLFEALEEGKDSRVVDMADLTRYLLYKATGIDYGVTEFEFDLFDPGSFNIIGGAETSSDFMSFLKEWLHYMEHGTSPKKNAAGTHYIVESDGYNHPTVGWGVDIFNSGYASRFRAAGYGTSYGSQIPIDFVDAIEDEILQKKMDIVDRATEGLNLTDYQRMALYVRAYNHWKTGFATLYNQYWNQERDDKYGTGATEGDYTHPLYTSFMGTAITSNGKVAPGLIKRRKSEWTMFQTGYCTYLNKYYVPNSSGNGKVGNLLEAADKIARYVGTNNYTYRETSYVNYTFPIQNSGIRTISCSSYIQQCFLEAGYSQFAGAEKIWANTNRQRGLAYFTNNGVNAHLIDLKDIQPGDILQAGSSPHVVMVYSVNGQNVVTKGVPEVLNSNQGFNGKIRTFSQLMSNGYYAIRIDN